MTLNKARTSFNSMPHFGYREMRAALEVAEHGSVTKAAESLGMSQPGLSRMVMRLEKGLGFPIFKRRTKKEAMQITQRGMYAIDHMARAITSMHYLKTEEPV